MEHQGHAKFPFDDKVNRQDHIEGQEQGDHLLCVSAVNEGGKIEQMLPPAHGTPIVEIPQIRKGIEPKGKGPGVVCSCGDPSGVIHLKERIKHDRRAAQIRGPLCGGGSQKPQDTPGDEDQSQGVQELPHQQGQMIEIIIYKFDHQPGGPVEIVPFQACRNVGLLDLGKDQVVVEIDGAQQMYGKIYQKQQKKRKSGRIFESFKTVHWLPPVCFDR